MQTLARDLLNAKLALEDELARPLYAFGVAYLTRWGETHGHIGAHERLQWRAKLVSILARHYARTTMVMQGRRPHKNPSLTDATQDQRRAAALADLAETNAGLILASLDNDLARQMTGTAVFDALDDGTKAMPVELETKEQGFGAPVEYTLRIGAAVMQTLKKWAGKIKGILAANTNPVAEAARQAQIDQIAKDLEVELVPQGSENGHIMQVWNSLMDGRERPAHHEAHGQERPVTMPFDVGGEKLRFPGDTTLGASLGNVINCFPGDTRVSGDVLAATRHWYSGELVEITTRRGHKLSGTPNHPVLTPEGWVALGAINEGGHVISRRIGWRDDACVPSVGHGRTLDVDDVEPTIEQVFNTLAESRLAVRVSHVAVDFHGDHPTHDVDVVAADCVLRFGVDATSFEHFDQFDFAAPRLDQRLFLPRSLASALQIAGHHAAAGRVGRRRDSLALVGTGTRETDQIGVAAVADGEARILQAESDRRSADAQRLGNCQHGNAAMEEAKNVDAHGVTVHPASIGLALAERAYDASLREDFTEPTYGVPDDFCDLRDAEAALVEFDCVVSVRRRHFDGHVFNLQTVPGMYHANGVSVHNCRCWLTSYHVTPDGTRTLLHVGPSAPTRRYRRPGDKEPPVVTPTSQFPLNGTSRGKIFLADKKPARFEQPTPSTVVIRRDGVVLGRASFRNGKVSKITIAPDAGNLGIEAVIRRSVQGAASMDRRPYPARP